MNTQRDELQAMAMRQIRERAAHDRLCAAAPDLLAALKALTLAAACETLPLDWGVRVKQARAAIAKAEGVS